MIINRLIILSLLGFVGLLACKDPAAGMQEAKGSDSMQFDQDSPDSTFVIKSCYENFFNGLPHFRDSGSAVLILGDGTRTSLTQFFKDEFMSPVSEYGIKDLDRDGLNELIVFNNTGGAHCCDEYHIFHQRREDEFELKAHIMGGQTCIDPSTNAFNFSFTENLGYFFACYACEFEDSTGAFKPMRDISLVYSNGALEVTPYDSIAEKQNLFNLEVLQNHGFEDLEGMMDNGWRKEFAMNFAVWHFNHGKNWNNTRQLFRKYYNFSDSLKVWQEFFTTLTESARENTF
jgi:hypothetical protein